MASSSTPSTIRLSRNIKDQLFHDPIAMKAYISYANFGKVHPGRFAVFQDFSTYEIDTLFRDNQALDLVDSTQNDFGCYPNLVKIFYANLNRGFYQGNDDEVWSSVRGVQIVLNSEILGTILGCRGSGTNLTSFEIDYQDRDTFHDIFESDEDFEFVNRNFRPKAKIVSLLLQGTITPRSGSFNNPTSKVCKALYAIFGNKEINWAQVILDELRPKNFEMGENTLYHGVYLTKIFKFFGVDFKGEEFISRKLFNHSNITLMKIPYICQRYESLAEKDERLAHEDINEEEEEEEEMEIEEEEEGDTSLESIDFPSKPTTKTLLKNQKTLEKNQRTLKRSVSKKLDKMSSKMNKFFSKVGKHLGLSSSSSSN